jgi:hypothetical protein
MTGQEKAPRAKRQRQVQKKTTVTVSLTPDQHERIKLFAQHNQWSIDEAAQWLVEIGFKHIAPMDIMQRVTTSETKTTTVADRNKAKGS